MYSNFDYNSLLREKPESLEIENKCRKLIGLYYAYHIWIHNASISLKNMQLMEKMFKMATLIYKY